jgi:hypothetical protein
MPTPPSGFQGIASGPMQGSRGTPNHKHRVLLHMHEDGQYHYSIFADLPKVRERYSDPNDTTEQRHISAAVSNVLRQDGLNLPVWHNSNGLLDVAVMKNSQEALLSDMPQTCSDVQVKTLINCKRSKARYCCSRLGSSPSAYQMFVRNVSRFEGREQTLKTMTCGSVKITNSPIALPNLIIVSPRCPFPIGSPKPYLHITNATLSSHHCHSPWITQTLCTYY